MEWIQRVLDFTSEYFWIFVLALFAFLLFFWLYKYNRITRAVNTVMKNIEERTNEAFELQKQGIEQMVNMFLDKLNDSVEGQFKSFAKSIEQYTEIQLKSQEQMEGFVRELVRGTRYQININEATESIVTSISKYNQQIIDVNTDLSAAMNNIVTLTDTLTEVVQYNREALEEIKAQKEGMKDQYSIYFESIAERIETFGKTAGGELEKTINKFAELTGNTYDQLKESIKASMDLWSESNNTALTNLEDQTNHLLNINNEISQRINVLNETLGSTAAAFADSVKSGTTDAFRQFDDGLSEITKRLSTTIKEIREAIEDLPVVIESLKNSLIEK